MTAYQVIELERTHQTPPEGTISVLLGDGSNVESPWQTASRYTHRRLQTLAEHDDIDERTWPSHH